MMLKEWQYPSFGKIKRRMQISLLNMGTNINIQMEQGKMIQHYIYISHPVESHLTQGKCSKISS